MGSRDDWCPRAPVGRQRAVSLADVGLELVAEVLQRRQHRRRRGIAEGAQRLADDVGCHPEEQVEILHLPLAPLDALKELVKPVAALAARRALAARLVTV